MLACEAAAGLVWAVHACRCRRARRTGLTLVQKRGSTPVEAADLTQRDGQHPRPGRIEVKPFANVPAKAGVLEIAAQPAERIAVCDVQRSPASLRGSDRQEPVRWLPPGGCRGISHESFTAGRRTARRGAEGVVLGNRAYPCDLNVDAWPHDDPESANSLIKQVLQPVLWGFHAALLSRGFDQFYEVGPGRVLRGLLRRIDRKSLLPNTRIISASISGDSTNRTAGIKVGALMMVKNQIGMAR